MELLEGLIMVSWPTVSACVCVFYTMGRCCEEKMLIIPLSEGKYGQCGAFPLPFCASSGKSSLLSGSIYVYALSFLLPT